MKVSNWGQHGMQSKYHLRVQFETLQLNVQGKTSISLTCETNLTEGGDEELQCDHPPPAQSCHDESCNPICQPSTNTAVWTTAMQHYARNKSICKTLKVVTRREKPICNKGSSLLITGFIHAHYELKYLFTCCFYHTYNLHCCDLALCLQPPSLMLSRLSRLPTPTLFHWHA
jgi:hypothetical protein